MKAKTKRIRGYFQTYPLVFTFLLFVTASVITLVSISRVVSPNSREELLIEIGKATINFVFLVLVGSAFTRVAQGFEHRRNAWLARRELLLGELTDGLAEQYSEIKKIRRLINANTTTTINMDFYSERMQEMNDVQLQLERYMLKARWGTRNNLLPISIEKDLRIMEHYLREILSEYEKRSSPPKNMNDCIQMTELSHLEDFIRSARVSFKPNFSKPYHRVAEAVSDEISQDLPHRLNPRKISEKHES